MELDRQRPSTSTASDPLFPCATRFAPRPLSLAESEAAASLGKRLRRLRRSTRRPREPRIAQVTLSRAAGLSRDTVGRIERGRGRVRRSTLSRIAVALAALRPRLGPSDELLAELVAAAGAAIAPERGREVGA